VGDLDLNVLYHEKFQKDATNLIKKFEQEFEKRNEINQQDELN
jgi:hypothetical protein